MTISARDPGLQPERTELSWRRTALSLAVGSVVAARLLPDAFGSPWWALPGLIGLLFSVALWGWSRRRYDRVTVTVDQTTASPGSPSADGTLLLAVALFVTAVGGFAIALAVVTFLR